MSEPFTLRIIDHALIAAYQTQRVSAITHVAEVDRKDPYGEGGKYKLVFKGATEELLRPILNSDAPLGAMQGPRYTTIERLRWSRFSSDLI